MGWASGAGLAEDVWKLFRKYVPEEERPRVAKQLIEAFRDEDWDTVDEAETLATDARWYNEEEYDALCIDDPKEADPYNDDDDDDDDAAAAAEYLDDENPTPR